WRYISILAVLIIVNVLEVIPAQLIGRAIDFISTGEITLMLMWQLIIAFVVVILLSYAGGFIWQYMLIGGAVKIESIIRMKLMRKFLMMSPSFFEKNKTGDLMARATNDLRSVHQATAWGVLTLIDATTFMGSIILAMGVTVSWELTFYALLPLPLLALIEAKLGRKINAAHKESQEAFSSMNNSVLEVVEGVRLTRSYVQEKDEYLERFMKVERLDALFHPLTILVTMTSFMVALGYGAVLANKGVITVGDIVTFNIYLNMLVWPMFALGMLFNILQRGNASLT